MRLRPTLALCLAFLLPAPLFADVSAPDPGSAIDLAESLYGRAEALGADLDGDGREETLLIHKEGCDGQVCPWTLIGALPDEAGWGVVAAGSGARTTLVETNPEGWVIRSDGVLLAWDGTALSPHHDLISTGSSRRASADEARRLGRFVGSPVRPMETRAFDLIPYRNGETWTLVVLGDDRRDAAEPHAFHLLGPDRAIRLSGSSLGRPWVYADQDGEGPLLQLVSSTPSGLLVEGVR